MLCAVAINAALLLIMLSARAVTPVNTALMHAAYSCAEWCVLRLLMLRNFSSMVALNVTALMLVAHLLAGHGACCGYRR
jgi:hypothetical protein